MIFLFFCIIIISLSFLRKRSTIIFLILSVIGFLIIGLNYDNPDYTNYVIAFQNAYMPDDFNIFEVLDIGNKIILAKSIDLGFDQYEDFRLFYSFTLFLIFATTIFKSCIYPACYMGIYILFYLLLDEIQFRNFSSFVILFPFMIYYINHQTKKGLLTYLIGIIIAFTLHFSAIFYGIFCLTLIKSNKLKIALICITIILLIVAVALEAQLAMIDRVQNYERPSFLGASYGCFLLFVNYFYIKWINEKCNVNKNIYSKIFSNYNIIIQINLLLLLICPAIFINVTISRIWRFISLINLIYLLNIIYTCNPKKKKLLIFSSVIYCLFVTYSFNKTEGVIESLFNNPLL